MAILLVAGETVVFAESLDVEQLSTPGKLAFERGDFREAVVHWEKAVTASRGAGDVDAEVHTSILLSGAYQALGLHRRAVSTLKAGLAVAGNVGGDEALLRVKARLGGALVLVREFEGGEKMLREALSGAHKSGDQRMQASVFNDLGNLFMAQGKNAEALAEYENSVERAGEAGDVGGMVPAMVNSAGAALLAGETDKTIDWNARASVAVERLEDGYAKAFMWLSIAQIDMELSESDPDLSEPFRLNAHQAIEQALKLANQLGDRRIQTYALGYMSELYVQDGQKDAALDLARRAMFAAQEAGMPEALYKWEWQVGRLLRARGENGPAMAAYRNAVQTMKTVRNDVSLGFGNSRGQNSFRKSEGPLFFQLADLLLQEARAAPDQESRQALLLEARNTVELLKAVELEDYFSDDCVDIQQTQTRSVEEMDEHTAVVYLIPLEERTEILIGLTSGLLQVDVPVGEEELTAEVNLFRRNLETRTLPFYLRQSWQLYDWLIRPIREILEENGVDTLVIVPDGALRTIPFAALQDSEQKRFLIEDLAVAVVPGLSLVAQDPTIQQEARLLLNGISEARQDYPELKYVVGELESLRGLYPGETLLNGTFTMAGIKKQITENQYSIIHIASHGEFNSDANETFILTYDTKLTLDDLEGLIRPSQYRGRPVELLVLSACQTAAGDDRAALGLAGVAIKAGARSALATLWYVNDQSTSDLVTEVYEILKNDPTKSKAQALQAAQIKLLGDRRYKHPCYWSPYLIIGNWL